MLHSLPGGEEPDRETRWCLSRLLDKYPSSVRKPMVVLQKFVKDHERWGFKWLQTGDLEMDFLRSLGQVQRLAKENPLEIEVNFRK
jgi:hypothetical protein